MKANEIRLGNIVEYHILDDPDEKKEWWEVNVIDIDDIAYMLLDGDDGNDNYRPISITPQWLDDLGFIKPPSGKLLYKPMPIIKAEIHFEEFRKSLVCVVYCSTGSLIPIDIKYVHQLQNLYFALTGEELTLKPKK